MKKHYRILFLFSILPLFLQAQQPPPQRTPEQDSAIARTQRKTQADHKAMLDLLGIKTLRQGANGSNPQAPNAANYDEAKANPYPKLPESLTLKNGQKVTTATDWWHKRRPEIVEDFDREVYGRMPANTPSVKWEVVSELDTMNGTIAVKTKQLVGHVDNSAFPDIKVDILMSLTIPANATKPVPVMVEFGFVFPAGARRPPANPNAANTPQGPTWQQPVLEKGWGYASL